MKDKRILVGGILAVLVAAVTAFAAQRIVSLVCDKAVMGDVSIKTLRTGGDPLNGTDSTEVTATAAELNYLDVTAGTATASKALVLNSSKTVASVNSMSVTGTLTIAEGGLANSTVLSADIKDGEIVNADVNASAAIAVSKLATTGTLPAWNAAAVTNLAGGNIASGNIAAARINNALLAPGPIGTGTPAAGSFTTLAASGEITFTGEMRFTDTIRLTCVDVPVTNNQVLLPALARATYRYTPATATTNTVGNPTDAGDWVAFLNVGTNNMVIAKAANIALGSATRTLGQYDILVLRAITSGIWIEEGFTDNTLGP